MDQSLAGDSEAFLLTYDALDKFLTKQIVQVKKTRV
jgi:hypothetical protein